MTDSTIKSVSFARARGRELVGTCDALSNRAERILMARTTARASTNTIYERSRRDEISPTMDHRGSEIYVSRIV